MKPTPDYDLSFDYDLPATFDEPRLALDPDCPICHGTGVRRDGGRPLECTCLLRQRVLHYLTPTYGPDIPWDPDFQPQPYISKNVFIQNQANLPLGQFRRLAYRLVKSYLITTHQRYSHRTLTPYELFRALFNGSDRAMLAQLTHDLGVVILVLNGDDYSVPGTYPYQIPWLIRRRRDNGLQTWIILHLPLNSGVYKGGYNHPYGGLDKPLAECLADGFVELPLNQNGGR